MNYTKLCCQLGALPDRGCSSLQMPTQSNQGKYFSCLSKVPQRFHFSQTLFPKGSLSNVFIFVQPEVFCGKGLTSKTPLLTSQVQTVRCLLDNYFSLTHLSAALRALFSWPTCTFSHIPLRCRLQTDLCISS